MMKKLLLFSGVLVVISCNTAILQADKANSKVKSDPKLSPARIYDQQTEAITKDWMRASKAFFSYYSQFEPRMSPTKKKELIPNLFHTMAEYRKQTKRFATISPVPVSMKIADQKYSEMASATERSLDAIKRWVYSDSSEDSQEALDAMQLGIGYLLAASQEKRRVLGQTANTKKYVPG